MLKLKLQNLKHSVHFNEAQIMLSAELS